MFTCTSSGISFRGNSFDTSFKLFVPVNAFNDYTLSEEEYGVFVSSSKVLGFLKLVSRTMYHYAGCHFYFLLDKMQLRLGYTSFSFFPRYGKSAQECIVETHILSRNDTFFDSKEIACKNDAESVQCALLRNI